VSREHTVASPVPGLTVIAGGKFTTYRVMAKDAVDFALGADAVARPSVTKTIPLAGAGAPIVDELRAEIDGFGWDAAMVDHLLHRYGTNIRDIIEICRADAGMAQPLAEAAAYLRAEIVYAITHEGALHLEDVMDRRTRMVYEYPDEAKAALPEVARIAADQLRWAAGRLTSELASYRAIAAADAAAALEPDDASAARARAVAPSVVPLAQPARPTA